MRKTSDGLTVPDKIQFWVRHNANASNQRLPIATAGAPAPSQPSPLAHRPAANPSTASSDQNELDSTAHDGPRQIDFAVWPNLNSKSIPDNTIDARAPTAPSPDVENGQRSESASIGEDGPKEKPHIAIRFYKTSKIILFSSWLNLLLIFVPVGIALGNSNISPIVVFAVNAVAIIPLAGLLSFATESIARRLGDTVGALMNVTFGNAVELIIL
jgi:Ca2+:H+ antiporter